MNLYTCTTIQITSIETAKFQPSPHKCDKFGFTHDSDMTRPWKIHIAQEPEFIDGKWKYKLIAVFNRFIAILSTGPSIGTSYAGNIGRWIVLKHISLARESMLMLPRAMSASSRSLPIWVNSLCGNHLATVSLKAQLIS